MYQVLKRDGKVTDFDLSEITQAITMAFEAQEQNYVPSVIDFLALKVTANFEAAVDLIYNPAETLFLRQAKEAGKKYVNGLFMLVAQAVAAQEIWQGQQYESDLIVKIMADLERNI